MLLRPSDIMLALKQALSLTTIKPVEGWSPLSEGSLVAWYKYDTGIELDGSLVEVWQDSSTNSYDMTSSSGTRPTFDASSVNFNSATPEFLQTSGQIILKEAFTIAFRIQPTAFNNTILGDNTTTQEYLKLISTTNLKLQIDGSSLVLSNSSAFSGAQNIIITRDSSNLVELYVDGALEDDGSLSGYSDIDALGVRATDINSFDGAMFEVQIYDSSSAELNTNINARLSTL